MLYGIDTHELFKRPHLHALADQDHLTGNHVRLPLLKIGWTGAA
ncbi:hypothetical protein ACWGLG_17390 [Streptomyces antimycoticus]|nr:hypothetical protein [Streptomyces antimycoticus]